jgi:hypothetical protein
VFEKGSVRKMFVFERARVAGASRCAFLAKYYSDNQMKTIGMGETRGTNCGEVKYMQGCGGKT